MIDIQQFHHPKLHIENWQMEPTSTCIIVGKNGSGKRYIGNLLSGELQSDCGHQATKSVIPHPDNVALVSFETLQSVYEHELDIDETDMTNEVDFGTPVRAFLPSNSDASPLIDQFDLRHRLNTGFRLLSSGEARKLLILKALVDGACWIVLDNPFDELDPLSKEHLSKHLSQLSSQGISLIVLLSNSQDIPKWANQFCVIEQGKLQSLSSLNKQSALNHIHSSLEGSRLDELALINAVEQNQTSRISTLVNIKRATVTYENNTILRALSLDIEKGQHTLIVGPNGCGKSTLLQLITGDCPQCYSNHVVVMGYKRGNGESIWDIKKHLGIVSPDLHRNYRVRCCVLYVVISGLKDSIGVYTTITQSQKRKALDWLTVVGLTDKANSVFQQLSFGEQRLVLIARALVKSPPLLVLDEPTQGLDEPNRKRILACLTRVAALEVSTLVMVSHRLDERLAVFNQTIDFANL